MKLFQIPTITPAPSGHTFPSESSAWINPEFIESVSDILVFDIRYSKPGGGLSEGDRHGRPCLLVIMQTGRKWYSTLTIKELDALLDPPIVIPEDM